MNLKRLIVWFIDAVTITLITFLISLLTLGIGFFFFAGLWLIVGFFFRFLGLAIYSSTMGMRMTGIEFLQGRGPPVRWALCAFAYSRTMIAYATSIQIVSVILMLITSRKQGLVDLIWQRWLLIVRRVNRAIRSKTFA